MHSWAQVLASDDFVTIEDPITSFNCPKELFDESYKPFLDTLDGKYSEDCIEFFFEPSPIQFGVWRFVDEARRIEFRDACVDHGLLLDWADTCAGESKEEKEARQLEHDKRQKSMEKHRLKLGARRAAAQANKAVRQTEQLHQSLAEVTKKLSATDLTEQQRSKLLDKQSRIIQRLDSTA